MASGVRGMNAKIESASLHRSEKLRELQLKELKLIRLFVDICERESLTYFMLNGTMLGAVRHAGYIPWDDDADFGMPRGDYERFLAVVDEYLPQDVTVESANRTPGCIYYIARLTDTRTQVRFTGTAEERIENVGIDIFPLDGMPNHPMQRKLHQFKLLFLRQLYRVSTFDKTILLKHEGRPWYFRLAVAVCARCQIQRLLSQERCWKLLDAALKKYPYQGSNYAINMMGAYKFKDLFEKRVYGNGALYPFEGLNLWGPRDYEFYLTQLYGDYMTPPPENERNHHQTEFLS